MNMEGDGHSDAHSLNGSAGQKSNKITSTSEYHARLMIVITCVIFIVFVLIVWEIVRKNRKDKQASWCQYGKNQESMTQE